MESNEEGKYYLCRFCDQIFLNGDEYRFHIRGHIALFSGTQEQSIDHESSNEETDVVIDVESNGVDCYESWRVLNSKQISSLKKFLCSQCGKGFGSVKALHGHMRCHSIKNFRHPEKSSFLSSEDGKFNGGVKPEFGNVIKKKRSYTSSLEYHELEGGAFGLMMLSKGLNDSDVIKVKNVISMMSSENVVKSSLKSNSQDVRVKGKRKAYDDRKDHKCAVCLKEFGSGQALGGHMRAHYNVVTSNETGLKEVTASADSFKVRRCLDFNGSIENDTDKDDDYFDIEQE